MDDANNKVELQPLNKETEETYEVINESTNKITLTVLNHTENDAGNHVTEKQTTEVTEQRCDTKIVVRPTSNEFEQNTTPYYLETTGRETSEYIF